MFLVVVVVVLVAVLLLVVALRMLLDVVVVCWCRLERAARAKVDALFVAAAGLLVFMWRRRRCLLCARATM